MAVVDTFGAEFGLDPESAPLFRTKASAWRGLISALEAEDLMAAAHEGVPPEVQDLLRSPPAGGVWVPAVAFQYVFRALDAQVDDEQMRVIARHSMQHGTMPILRPVIESLLRIMGTNPGGLIKRLPKVAHQQLQGIRLEIHDVQDRSFRARLEYEHVNGLPRATFTFWQGVLWAVFDVCGVTPSDVHMSIDQQRSTCEYEFHWE